MVIVRYCPTCSFDWLIQHVLIICMVKSQFPYMFNRLDYDFKITHFVQGFLPSQDLTSWILVRFPRLTANVPVVPRINQQVPMFSLVMHRFPVSTVKSHFLRIYHDQMSIFVFPCPICSMVKSPLPCFPRYHYVFNTGYRAARWRQTRMAQPGAQGVLQPSGQLVPENRAAEDGRKDKCPYSPPWRWRTIAGAPKGSHLGSCMGTGPSQMSHQQLARLGSHGPVHHLANRYISVFSIVCSW